MRETRGTWGKSNVVLSYATQIWSVFVEVGNERLLMKNTMKETVARSTGFFLDGEDMPLELLLVWQRCLLNLLYIANHVWISRRRCESVQWIGSEKATAGAICQRRSLMYNVVIMLRGL